jgi:uncharacterized protein (TIGR02452 family)
MVNKEQDYKLNFLNEASAVSEIRSIIPVAMQKKIQRVQVFKETKRYCNVHNMTKVRTEKIVAFAPLTRSKPAIQTITTINEDCVETARRLATWGKTCMLNMANAENRGGGVERGAMAQEEELIRRSNLWYGLRQQFYPLADNEFIYSKNVKFFKDGQYNIQSISKIDVITVAAPCLIGFAKGKFPKGYSSLVHHKVKQMLEYPATQGVEHLVLSAFGCGAFRNNPNFISRVFKQHIKNLPYKTIVFSVLDDHNSKANGVSNYQAFSNMFGSFPAPRVSSK